MFFGRCDYGSKTRIEARVRAILWVLELVSRLHFYWLQLSELRPGKRSSEDAKCVLPFEARHISYANAARCLLTDASCTVSSPCDIRLGGILTSTLALSCLILDHLLWPDAKFEDMERLRTVGKRSSCKHRISRVPFMKIKIFNWKNRICGWAN